MTYVRISLMRSLSGRELEAEKLNAELVAFYRAQEGCLQAQAIQAADGSGEIGRVSFWTAEAMADAAATRDRSMYLRSRLNLLVRRGHQDRSFYAA